jgi:hypothetical protein
MAAEADRNISSWATQTFPEHENQRGETWVDTTAPLELSDRPTKVTRVEEPVVDTPLVNSEDIPGGAPKKTEEGMTGSDINARMEDLVSDGYLGTIALDEVPSLTPELKKTSKISFVWHSDTREGQRQDVLLLRSIR